MNRWKILSILGSLFFTFSVMAQYCRPMQSFGFASSPYTGGHHQHQALLAHPAAYNPQGYYFPQGNVHLSQPPMFGAGMNCMPMMMPPGGFQTSFGAGAIPPMNPLYGMLPALGEGLGKLATGLLNRKPSSGQSYSEFLSQRRGDSRSSSGRDYSSYTSPNRSGGPQVIPDSNSAGGSLGTATTTPPVEVPVATPVADPVEDPVETPPQPAAEEPEEQIVEAPEQPQEPVVPRVEEEMEIEDEDVGPPLVVTSPSEIPREEFEVQPQVPSVRPEEDQIIDAIGDLEESQEVILAPLPIENKDCRTLIKEQIRGNLPLEGAYRIMATFYQNCDVIEEVLDSEEKLPPMGITTRQNENKVQIRSLTAETKDRYINEHPYLKIVKEAGRPAAGCQDVLARPPIFSFGAKAQYSSRRDRVNLFRDQSQRPICHYANIDCENSLPVTALDCSGFVHAALRASGLRIQKTNEALDYSTSGMIESMKSPDSCLEAPAFNANETIKGGDIISLSEHHMIMITSTAPDPLGVQKGIRAGNCNSIRRSDFQFTYMHSSALRDMGLTHVSSQLPQASPTLLNNLLLLARETCNRHLEESKGMKAMVKYTNPNRTLAVMRHVGDADPACKMDRPVKLESEECVEDCLK